MKSSISALLLSLAATVAWAQTPAAPVAPAATPAPAPAPVAAPAAPAAAATKAAVAPAAAGDVTTGKAAWYGKKFNGRRTASGQRFNAASLTAASNTLPFGTLVKVTNLKNKKSVTVRITDRGPQQADRIIDVTRAAAARLGMLKSGVAEVEVKVVGNAKSKAAVKGRTLKKSAKKA
jgi:rare lipoprotein A